MTILTKTPLTAAIHDLSGFGRCSLTIVLPVLSAMGVQCCPMPTACLSTHTGGFDGNTFLDLTDALSGAMDHYRRLNLPFDAVYTGFMGSARQMALSADFLRWARTGGALSIVDPVMGDNGRLYRTYTPEMCTGMAALSAEADVIIPNRTEAALLLNVPYDHLDQSEAALRQTAEALSLDGRRSVVLTGVSLTPGQTGAACFDRDTAAVTFVQTDFVGRAFHGTGDLFASVLTGALLQGDPLPRAAQRAAKFVRDCAARTAAEDLPPREGVDFEPLLGRLTGERREP